MGETGTAPAHRPHLEPLRWIGAYKLLKGALAIVAGLMVLRLMHRDLPAIATHWMTRLHIQPHSKLGVLVLRRLLEVKGHRLEWVAAGLFGYVPIAIAEGVGLMMRQYWAEWLTVVTTAALIPLEAYELVRRPTWPRMAILILNLAVIAYLVWRIRRDHYRRLRRMAEGSAAPPVSNGPTATN